MKVSIDKFTIETLDDYNFSLFETRPKKPMRGSEEDTSGLTTMKHIGYFGSLSFALKKILSETLKASDELTTQQLFDKLTTIETAIDIKYGHIKPKGFENGSKI